MNMKEQYSRINMSKLPSGMKSEFAKIKSGSENFDPDYVDIYKENFDLLYSLVKSKYPEALEKAATVKKTKPSDKKKIAPKTAKKHELKKPPVKKEGMVDECRDVLKGAGYTITKRASKKGGKPMVTKKKRQERTIIKERVEDTFKPILKDISGSKEKDEKYSEMKKTIESIQGLFSTFLQRLNNLAEDNSMEKVKKIEKLLKEILS